MFQNLYCEIVVDDKNSIYRYDNEIQLDSLNDVKVVLKPAAVMNIVVVYYDRCCFCLKKLSTFDRPIANRSRHRSVQPKALKSKLPTHPLLPVFSREYALVFFYGFRGSWC
jgi:hypothetical protein